VLYEPLRSGTLKLEVEKNRSRRAKTSTKIIAI
jgi:hypothetical protein